MSGELATQTPPCPTAILEGTLRPRQDGEPIGLPRRASESSRIFDPVAAWGRLASRASRPRSSRSGRGPSKVIATG